MVTTKLKPGKNLTVKDYVALIILNRVSLRSDFLSSASNVLKRVPYSSHELPHHLKRFSSASGVQAPPTMNFNSCRLPGARSFTRVPLFIAAPSCP